jgi:hypothetical protein
METRNHLLDGRDRGYLEIPLHSRVQPGASGLNLTTNLMLAKKRDAARLKRRRRRPPR